MEGKDRAGFVVLVDDNEIVRETLEALLESEGLQVRSFASAEEFLSSESPPRPACLVLDLKLPRSSGLDIQKEVLRAGHDLPILFLSGHGDIPSTVSAMKAGAIDFLQKPAKSNEIIAAVQRALDLDREALLEQAELRILNERYDSLTRRERQVLDEVTSGLSNKQIAGNLGIGEKTVKVHRARMMSKMEARSLADLVRMAVRLEIGSSEDPPS